MRLVTYSVGPAGPARLGVRVGHRVLDVEAASRVDGEPLPNSMKALLREGRGAMSRVQALAKAAQSSAGRFAAAMHEERAIRFLPPVPDPGRFAYVGNASEEQLVAFAKAGPGLLGHNAKLAKVAGSSRLDCEPQVVLVIGRRASNLGVDDDPVDYVAGVTLLNDLVDHGQPREAALASLGPELVTFDEIADSDDLWITCTVNGEERLRARTGDRSWKTADILEHFSREAIEPGDMVSMGASGGVASRDADADAPFLKPGDVVECSIEGLTTLRNTIAAS